MPKRSLILPVPLPVTLPVFPPGVLVGYLAVPLLPVSSLSIPPGPPGVGDVLGGGLEWLPLVCYLARLLCEATLHS